MEKKLHRFISSTVSYHDFREAVETAKELGCGIEISRFGRLADIDINFEKNKKEYREILNDYDIDVTLHGFFSNLNVAAKDPAICAISRKRYYQSLELAAEFGVSTVVFHTCFNNLLKQKKYQEMYFMKNLEFFREFIPNFEDLGITATIENVHEPNSDLIRSLLVTINSPNLKATIDIGHANLHSIYPVSHWIKEYGILLHHMHFHNNFKDEDSHSSLLKGDIDIKAILSALQEIQLYPQITFEIFEKDALVESVKHFNSLCDELGIEYC